MGQRGSFSHKDAMGGGLGFKEGTVLIDKSVVELFQYPAPKNAPNQQSDPFTCVAWHVTKLDADLNVIELGENEPPTVIRLRMCTPKVGRPGMLKEKDWDNTEVVPKDLGDEVGTEGNALYLEDNQRIEGSGWAVMEESLSKAGFKESVIAKGVATLYEGMVAHLVTVPGKPYIAKKANERRGIKVGDTVTPENLVVERVIKFPYDKDSKVKVGGKSASAGKANGKAKDADDDDDAGEGGEGNEKLVAATVEVLENVNAKFKAANYTGKPIDKKVFITNLAKEMMRQDTDEELQSEIVDFLKGGGLSAVAKEAGFKFKEDKVTFVADNE